MERGNMKHKKDSSNKISFRAKILSIGNRIYFKVYLLLTWPVNLTNGYKGTFQRKKKTVGFSATARRTSSLSVQLVNAFWSTFLRKNFKRSVSPWKETFFLEQFFHQVSWDIGKFIDVLLVLFVKKLSFFSDHGWIQLTYYWFSQLRDKLTIESLELLLFTLFCKKSWPE